MTLADVRHGVRLLAANPGFTAVAVLTLALGIGANTAIFTIVDAVLLRRTPLADAERLAVVWETDRNTGTTREPGSYPDFLDYRSRAKTAERIAAFSATEVNYTADGGEPVRLQALAVTSDFFELLGVRPSAGRGFTDAEAREGGASVVVISDTFWTTAFGRSADVLGRTIRIDGEPATVVGVMPARSDFGVYQVLRSADYARVRRPRSAGGRRRLAAPAGEPADPATHHAPDLHAGAAA